MSFWKLNFVITARTDDSVVWQCKSLLCCTYDREITSSQIQLPAIPLSYSDCGQVVHTHIYLSWNGVIWYCPKSSDDRR